MKECTYISINKRERLSVWKILNCACAVRISIIKDGCLFVGVCVEDFFQSEFCLAELLRFLCSIFSRSKLCSHMQYRKKKSFMDSLLIKCRVNLLAIYSSSNEF